MYKAYRRNLPVKVIVASGLHDTTGLFRQPTADDIQQVSQWMERFAISDRMGWSIVAGHGHCQLPESQWPEVQAFIDRFLLGRQVDTGGVSKCVWKSPKKP